MLHRVTDNPISLKKIQSFITALPIFSLLSTEESRVLANLMQEVEYEPNEVMVLEDTIIDSVFILTKGRAEVTRLYVKKSKITRKLKRKRVPLAKLGPHDAIGLNDTGFYSATGKRTATVTALSKVKALVLGTKELRIFLEQYPHLLPDMHKSTLQLLKIKLIKQSLPFNRLSHERIAWLADKVETSSVPAGEVIFTEGESGDHCYLISKGEVEITSKSKESDGHRLAILKSPTLFGEATLITHSKRNATARALTDCELLILSYDYLSELLESEKNVAETFMTLMVDRSRPLRNPMITVHNRLSTDGQKIVILKNSATGNYFKLSKEGWFIWQQLDGKQSMQEITLALTEKFGMFAPDIVAALISRLARSDFVTKVDVVESKIGRRKQPLWVRMTVGVRRILEARFAIGDADPWLTKLYNKAIRFLFTRVGQAALILISILGTATFAIKTANIVHILEVVHDAWMLLFLLIPFAVLTVVIHEFGHAFAVKAFGFEVHFMGVGWYWLGPVAFTDTSDMWLSTRWPRIIVNLAGIFVDIISASIASLLLLVAVNPYFALFLWIFALFTYINAFRMLNPLQEWDGYYILMDLVDRPCLRQSSVLWLVKTFPKSLRQPKLFKKHLPEVCYWLCCIAFLLLVSVLTLLIQTVVLKIIGIHSSNSLVSLALPFIVVLISCLGILADLRQKREEL